MLRQVSKSARDGVDEVSVNCTSSLGVSMPGRRGEYEGRRNHDDDKTWEKFESAPVSRWRGRRGDVCLLYTLVQRKFSPLKNHVAKAHPNAVTVTTPASKRCIHALASWWGFVCQKLGVTNVCIVQCTYTGAGNTFVQALTDMYTLILLHLKKRNLNRGGKEGKKKCGPAPMDAAMVWSGVLGTNQPGAP